MMLRMLFLFTWKRIGWLQYREDHDQGGFWNEHTDILMGRRSALI